MDEQYRRCGLGYVLTWRSGGQSAAKVYLGSPWDGSLVVSVAALPGEQPLQLARRALSAACWVLGRRN